VYAITDAGRQRLHELLTAAATDERTFAVQLAFCGLLAHEQRLELLTRRQQDLRGRIAELDATAVAARSGDRALQGRRTSQWPSDRYRRALRDREIVTLRSELVWLDDLIAHERGDADDAMGDRAHEQASLRDATDPATAAGNAAHAVPAQTTSSTPHPGPIGPPTLSGGFPQ
jgi:DNA-binding PadR family transcriptional regulator